MHLVVINEFYVVIPGVLCSVGVVLCSIDEVLMKYLVVFM